MERCGDFFVHRGKSLPFSVHKRVERGDIGFSLSLQILNLFLHGFKPRRFPFDPDPFLFKQPRLFGDLLLLAG